MKVAFRDEKMLLRIPDLVTDDVTATVISEHCHSYLRGYKRWWVELDVWGTAGYIHLPNRNIVITVTKA